jgi:hypothetical protein
MGTLNTTYVNATYLQHPSATSPNIELQSDGSVIIPGLPIPTRIDPFFLMGA